VLVKSELEEDESSLSVCILPAKTLPEINWMANKSQIESNALKLEGYQENTSTFKMSSKNFSMKETDYV
jgi:hypothetical protein